LKVKWIKTFQTAIGVVIGNIILAFTVAVFIVPKGIIMGGATGISLTISHYISANLSLIVLFVNGVLFLLGACVLGKKFAFTTIASTFMYPVFLSIIQNIPGLSNITDSDVLAVVYGGALLGLGMGLIIRVGASTGGTDILALVSERWFHLPVAVFLYIIDFIVLLFQAVFSDSEQILYGIANLVISTFVLNRIMLIGKSQIQLFIISKEYEKIREDVLKQMDAGATMVPIETGYENQIQKGVLCVINSRKLYAAKEIILAADPKAFVTISQVREVKGSYRGKMKLF
jgi:uncharacterized membrane-anchored protein YitT (DUF2179 family)